MYQKYDDEPQEKKCGCWCCLETFFCGTIPWFDCISIVIAVIGCILLERAASGLDSPEIQLFVHNLYVTFQLSGTTGSTVGSVVKFIHALVIFVLTIDAVGCA